MRNSVGKALEHRSALTPTTAKALIDAGYTLKVERSGERIFEDSEFEAVGATLVPENTWREAPLDNIIIGLKELPVDTCKPQVIPSPHQWLLIHEKSLLSTHISSSHTAINNKVAGKRSSRDSPAVVEPSSISSFSQTRRIAA